MSFQPVDPDARFETRIRTLGPCTVKSPDRYRRFVRDTDRVLYDLDADRVIRKAQANEEIITFERAGPRETLFFEPAHVNAAIVTCGGLCPGLNDVIRAIVDELHYVYGVSRVVGIPFGYAGLNPALGLSPTEAHARPRPPHTRARRHDSRLVEGPAARRRHGGYAGAP